MWQKHERQERELTRQGKIHTENNKDKKQKQKKQEIKQNQKETGRPGTNYDNYDNYDSPYCRRGHILLRITIYCIKSVNIFTGVDETVTFYLSLRTALKNQV